jgi:hypothetical protein
MDVHDRRWLSDLELLQIEMDLLWGTEAGPETVFACAREGAHLRLGSTVPPDAARALTAEVDGVISDVDLEVPPQVERWRVLLEDALGAAVRLAPGSGPSYLIGPDVTFRATADLVRSDGAEVGPLRTANPGNWGADEWQALLDGHLGPWVMARQGEQIISICHTPVSNSIAAEAGVWTPRLSRAGSRGRDHGGMGGTNAPD